ncbi:hypothetical protein CGMCC3_g15443 [Colletotrichum fructicola]|nr:uncharacterized protein CGMCC3_g15443 [Colletotrichum fructicola]KAE9568419.1 hypothetical protein CGMCC3_g15443 [Colletotrichum fructicola]
MDAYGADASKQGNVTSCCVSAQHEAITFARSFPVLSPVYLRGTTRDIPAAHNHPPRETPSRKETFTNNKPPNSTGDPDEKPPSYDWHLTESTRIASSSADAPGLIKTPGGVRQPQPSGPE